MEWTRFTLSEAFQWPWKRSFMITRVECAKRHIATREIQMSIISIRKALAQQTVICRSAVQLLRRYLGNCTFCHVKNVKKVRLSILSTWLHQICLCMYIEKTRLFLPLRLYKVFWGHSSPKLALMSDSQTLLKSYYYGAAFCGFLREMLWFIFFNWQMCLINVMGR